MSTTYRGRIAPSPTGYLHLGHARTFWIAYERAVAANGTVILRNEDIDAARVRPEFVRAFFEDLSWLGIRWEEGPDIGGPCAPYSQSERQSLHRARLEELLAKGLAYACTCSRKEIQASIAAPHLGEEEPLYPGTCREKRIEVKLDSSGRPEPRCCIRFGVPDGCVVRFTDGRVGPTEYVAGRDFGDFVLWRNDGVPSYQLAVVTDDSAMGITEVVRGEDLLLSTARQLLLYEAFGATPPQWYHCPLVKDEAGNRLAKRSESLSLRALRARGVTSEQLRAAWDAPETLATLV